MLPGAICPGVFSSGTPSLLVSNVLFLSPLPSSFCFPWLFLSFSPSVIMSPSKPPLSSGPFLNKGTISPHLWFRICIGSWLFAMVKLIASSIPAPATPIPAVLSLHCEKSEREIPHEPSASPFPPCSNLLMAWHIPRLSFKQSIHPHSTAQSIKHTELHPWLFLI